MSATARPSKEVKLHHSEWEEDIFPTMSYSKFVCPLNYYDMSALCLAV